ncbi:MAG: hypothetical protein ACRD1K_21515 [Acidimicrobiales bacterium]
MRSLPYEFPVSGSSSPSGRPSLWADSPLRLAAGYGPHRRWDLVHHPRAVTTPVHTGIHLSASCSTLC